ncbi:uncharacterized protein LOC126724838 [Quercus robur]|uniref:uncharacterized protein LOC126724838 n=1 Tax=Quercus robur TaxID=38942 RepID=UPI002163CFCD|nr:uncharacterized protein LOC126724838 [Quercus robur]
MVLPLSRINTIVPPLFFLHSSPPSLGCECCCRHCERETLHLSECPEATTIRKKCLPNIASMEIMFEGMVATGKNVWTPSGQIPKESTEEFGDSTNSKEFVDPQYQPPVDVDPMDVEGPSLSRTGLAMNKGKGLASGVHLFKGIHK